VTYPEIYEMQARAIMEAACELAKKRIPVVPEIMIPLVGHVNELAQLREVVVRVAKETIKAYGAKVKYTVGTMIELPRAAITADVIAEKIKGRIEGQTVGTVTVDERSNKIFIVAYPGRIREMEELLPLLDAPTKEVLVEARVLQISFLPKMDYGIDWNVDFRKSEYTMLRKMSFNNILMDEDDSLASSSNLLTNYSRYAIPLIGKMKTGDYP